MQRRHLFIVNPTAGKTDRTNEIREKLEALASHNVEPFQLEVTRKSMHAPEIVRQHAARGGALCIYACGGDGTLNEVVNGAAGFDNVAVTHFPIGTGNDFLKTFGDGAAAFQSMERLVRGTPRAFDLYAVNDRYGINIGSVGFDCRVGESVHRFSKFPLVKGKGAYNLSLLYNVFRGMKTHCDITVDGAPFPGPFFMLAACNGCCYGGGFYAMPDAVPDDGLLDFLLVKPVSRFSVARFAGIYARGGYRELTRFITYLRGKTMRIKAFRPMPVNVDGEIITGQDLEMSVARAKIQFILPEGLVYAVRKESEKIAVTSRL